MKRKMMLLLSLISLTTLVSINALAATIEFSADFSMTLAGGKAMTGKSFVKGDKIRNELLVMGQTSITIARQDKRFAWVLIPAAKQYREMPMKYDPAHPTPDMPFDTKEIGKDKVNGYDCKLVQLTFKNPEYGMVVNWMATQLNMPVRVQVKKKDGTLVMTIDYSNIKVGSQPDSLFEIPAGYSKMDTKE